ncbi:MAG: VWA domain-containing protein [Rikenellaceae bacterium]|nr:VWA domain-containing protein [Rikenellaceae bacterium]
MTFANPYMLWLAALVVPMVGYYIWRDRQGGATVTLSSVEGLKGAPRTLRYWLRHLPVVLRCAVIILLAVALARPQSSEQGSTTTVEGIDIVLALDVSGTMLAADFQPNRLVAAKDVAAKFIADRPNDRIGLVVFAGESYTQSPLTTDRASLQTLLARVEFGTIEDGTAIGMGLATAVNRLRDSEAKSKVVILLTDGVNNAGQVAPMSAAEIAAEYGIRVYTIGVGKQGYAPYPVYDSWGNLRYQQAKVEIDEQTLTDIAAKTGGEYFRATDKGSLYEVYERINKLEKSRIETDDFVKYNELYGNYLLWALVLLLVEFVVRRLWLNTIP